MKKVWDKENTEKLIANVIALLESGIGNRSEGIVKGIRVSGFRNVRALCFDCYKNLNIYELHELFQGLFTKKQIWHNIESLGLQIKKVEPRKLPNRTKHNRHFFDTIDSKEKAYVLGLWVSDGWINKKDYQVGFCNN